MSKWGAAGCVPNTSQDWTVPPRPQDASCWVDDVSADMSGILSSIYVTPL